MDAPSPSFVPMSLTSAQTLSSTNGPGSKRTYHRPSQHHHTSQLGALISPGSNSNVSSLKHSRNASLPSSVTMGDFSSNSILSSSPPKDDGDRRQSGRPRGYTTAKRPSVKLESTVIMRALGMPVSEDIVPEEQNDIIEDTNNSIDASDLKRAQTAHPSIGTTSTTTYTAAKDSAITGMVMTGESSTDISQYSMEQMKDTIDLLRKCLVASDLEKKTLQQRIRQLEVEKVSNRGIPREEMDKLEKAFAQQEALLEGYQRENERSVIALEETKRRERRMVTHLQKLYGAEWEEQVLDADGRRSPTRQSLGGAALQSIQSIGGLQRGSSIKRPTEKRTIEENDESKEKGINSELILNHLDSVRLLVAGMERRLIERASELDRKEKEARGWLN